MAIPRESIMWRIGRQILLVVGYCKSSRLWASSHMPAGREASTFCEAPTARNSLKIERERLAVSVIRRAISTNAQNTALLRLKATFNTTQRLENPLSLSFSTFLGPLKSENLF